MGGMVRWWWDGVEVGTVVPGSGREVGGGDACAYKGYQSERLYSIICVMMMIVGGLTSLLAIIMSAIAGQPLVYLFCQ